MRYGIFSDVHANMEALEVVLGAIELEGVDQLMCAGDLVGYGADPVACLQLLRDKKTCAVCGNHDCAASGQMDLSWFNEYARSAIEWTTQRLPKEEISYLKELPLVWTDQNVTVVHGSLDDPKEFQYVFSLLHAEASLSLQTTPVTFIGHTHVPGIFLQQGEEVTLTEVTQIRLDPNQKALVNVGSVGQPRDGDPRAAYCLYDSATGQLEIRRVSYPLEKTQAKIRQAGLPDFLANRLAIGT